MQICFYSRQKFTTELLSLSSDVDFCPYLMHHFSEQSEQYLTVTKVSEYVTEINEAVKQGL